MAGATVEAIPARSQPLRASSLKKPISLMAQDYRLSLEPDGSLRSFDSLPERRAVFGFERLSAYKVQAGVVVQGQKPDWALRVRPQQAQMSGKFFDSVEATHSVEFFQAASAGYLRHVKLKNGGSSPLTLRLMDVLDPTASQLGDVSKWGSLGVNAFNRGSHVAMDEISDIPSARVVGSMPSPKKLFMTTDRSRVRELVAAGDLGDPTAGMSGQVIIVSLHELELQPGEAKEVTFASIYNPSKLEEALSDFGRLQGDWKPAKRQGTFVAASSPALTESASWAVASLFGARHAKFGLDKLEAVKASGYVDKDAPLRAVEASRSLIRRDGAVPHSLDQMEPGPLETAVLLQAVSSYLLAARDKKASRSLYPLVKKLAAYFMASSKDYCLKTSPALPQGWRRSPGRGYQAGEVPEVSLAAAGALAAASQVARSVSKGDDAGRFRERAEMLTEMVKKRLVDERGFLSLCLDPSGRLRPDETIDMAVAAYRHGFLPSAEQAAAHRLLERDFETPYGPRTVPTSNRLYFNPSYGQGQLGGYWTRAALAHAIVCYRVGLAGIGSLALEKVARLVTEDAVKLGGAPGEFPYWVDVEGREVHGEEGDTVAAARLLEALVEGELGAEALAAGVSVSAAASSSLKWLLVAEAWIGEPVTVFVGRGGGKAQAFASGQHVDVKQGWAYGRSELLEPPVRGLHAVSFSGPGQAICVGNSTAAPLRGTLSFPPRDPDLSKRLSTPLEEYDRSNCSWTKVSTIRVFSTMSFDVSLAPGEWKAFRISTA